MHANVQVFGCHKQPHFPSPPISERNTVQAPTLAITETVICSSEHLLAMFITATSDVQPTEHK
jgi:hypothetical protein